MKKSMSFSILIFTILCRCASEQDNVDMYSLAKQHQDDLRFAVYITAHSVDYLLSSLTGRREALSLLRCNGITKVYLEVYRSGLVVPPQRLKDVRDFFKDHDIEVVGGIATVPGEDFGVRQQGELGWFNWENKKTQTDITKVMHDVAPIFDTFIVDDFLCTADTSLESKAAKGEQSWSLYRRDLFTTLYSELFINPAKELNPDITIIIKYPQWYDRFHLFGYDVKTGPQLFDRVWVGTETRGQYTQRYGYVQPYEGFVNYRWLASLSGDKIGGAWFDHGDCDESDFIEQAYQSVLAGAGEIVLFEYNSFVNCHIGHHLLRQEFENLTKLARAVAKNPVKGIPAYKPPHSDAGGDLYIMDFIGMLGVPIVPVPSYPAEADVLFLPTQAAADPDIWSHVQHSLQHNATIILTAGFLANAPDSRRFCKLCGVDWPVHSAPMQAERIRVGPNMFSLDRSLDLEASLTLTDAESILPAEVGVLNIPFLTRKGPLFVLNTHTFSQADFNAVDEVLLCPKPLGLLEIPHVWADSLRSVFNSSLDFEMSAPTRVTVQPLDDSGWMIHNYNRIPVEL